MRLSELPLGMHVTLVTQSSNLSWPDLSVAFGTLDTFPPVHFPRGWGAGGAGGTGEQGELGSRGSGGAGEQGKQGEKGERNSSSRLSGQPSWFCC